MEVPECAGCRAAQVRIAELEAKVLELEAKLRDLLDKVKPPAPRRQEKMPPAPDKKPTGRKPGGQPGHPPHLKKRLPPERVNETVALVPSHCSKCQKELPQQAQPNDPAPTWHQVAELPPLTATITEFQGHYRICPCCGEVNHAPIPDEIRSQSVGPRLSATLAYLVGRHGMSKRGLEETVEDVFGVPIALGTIANLEQEMSAALTPVHEQALKAVQNAPVKNVDETGWKENGKKRWLWVAATLEVTAFIISPWRNLTALTRLLGAQMIGILCSDRWRTYDEWPTIQRQVCWAHLKRNWEKLAEQGSQKAQATGRACLEIHRRVFELWHLFRGGTITFEQLDDAMAPLMLALQETLRTGARSRDQKLLRHCERVLQVAPALWAFLLCDGVEPTNNHAERVLRPAVLWRRRSFGCHSIEGCRFVERLLTAVQSLRLQKRNVLQFLHDAIVAHRAKTKAPSLLPG